MKPRKKKSSFLARLFGGGKAPEKSRPKKKPAGRPAAPARPPDQSETPAAPAKPPVLTPLDRSIREIKQMASVGEKDPERLAMMLSRLLSKEREKRQADKEKFARMVDELVQRSQDGQGEEDSPGPGSA